MVVGCAAALAGNGGLPIPPLLVQLARLVNGVEVSAPPAGSCLALDAAKCLLIDGDRVIEAANVNGVAVVAE